MPTAKERKGFPMRLLLALALLTAALALACAGPEPTATPRPTATPVPTATPRPTATPIPTPTATPPPTATPVPVPTATAGPPTPTPVYAEHQWRQVTVFRREGFPAVSSQHRGFTLVPAFSGKGGYFNDCGSVLSAFPTPCMVRSVHHPNGDLRAYILIPEGYKVDRGDGRWMDNCAKFRCQMVPMPEIPDDW